MRNAGLLVAALIAFAIPATAATVSAADRDSGAPTSNGQVLPFGVQRIGGLESPTARIDGIDHRVRVDVAIADTGIDPAHEDLNVVGGVNVIGDQRTDEWQDNDRHGTHIAGTIAALDNDKGVVGVAPGARLYAVKTSETSDHVTLEAVLRGLEWVEENAAAIDVLIVETTFGYDQQDQPGGPLDQKIHAAYRRVVDAGVTVVTAAGNEGTDAGNFVPSRYDELITVSAMGDTDGEPGGLGPSFLGMKDDHFAWKYSNFGPFVDISAPGNSILSTNLGNSYAKGTGTSFSAPHVAGAAALILARHPQYSPARVREVIMRNKERGALERDPDEFNEGVVSVRGF